jgi:putative membrane protein
VLFERALHDQSVHVLQHASFFVTALLFWWTAIAPRGDAFRAGGAAIASLFTTMLHTGALGALLTFSTAPWYASYRLGIAGSMLTPLEDQQLGGLVMWVPGGFVYVGAALAIAARWLDRRPREAPAETALRSALGAPTGGAACPGTARSRRHIA